MTGAGIYFDGVRGARREVAVELGDEALRVVAADGATLAEWPYGEVEPLAAPDGVLRIGRRRNPALARLEIRDPVLAAAIDDRAVHIDRTGAADRRLRTKVVAWSVAAIAILVAGAIYGVPTLATRVTPLVPTALEVRLGAAVDKQMRAMLEPGRINRPFECDGAAGRAAFARLVGRLEAAARLPFALNAVVIRRPEANAIALPGGRVYVFEGFLAKASSPDEVAGVLAHEIGHVAHRDGLRSVLQAAGWSLLFGMLLGDFTGGGAVVLAVRTVLRSSYSREAESAADVYGANLVAQVGGDPQALGAVLIRIAGGSSPFARILLDHPEAKARAAALAAVARPQARQPLLEADEWAALKRICADG